MYPIWCVSSPQLAPVQINACGAREHTTFNLFTLYYLIHLKMRQRGYKGIRVRKLHFILSWIMLFQSIVERKLIEIKLLISFRMGKSTAQQQQKVQNWRSFGKSLKYNYHHHSSRTNFYFWWKFRLLSWTVDVNTHLNVIL